ncbi:unnamed protein product [Symbiodinium necroappetens]|uniref:Uncharacterized protein n=1 Tax=Symbiodinium necroappetens TaxID=1628268 RepID=A0A813BA88_9DINO|nr:unnamed protein product [Symbiodinium necroappetens]
MCSAASSAGCRCARSRLPGWCWQQLQTPRSAQGLQVPKSNAGRRGPGSGGVFEARLQLRQGGGLRQLLPSGLQRHWRTGFLTSVTCHCKANISDVVPGGSGDGTRRMGWTGVHAPVEGILRTLGRAAKDLHFTVNDAADELVNLVVLRAAGAGWGLDAESVPDTVQPCSGQAPSLRLDHRGLMRLQFRSAVDERGHLRSEVKALQSERDALAAQVERLELERVQFGSAQDLDKQELESTVQSLVREIKACQAEASTAKDEVQRLSNALDAAQALCEHAEARAAAAEVLKTEASAQQRLAEGNVLRLTTEIEALKASSSLVLRRAERCDAAEAEAARLQGDVCRLRQEEQRLRLLEERLSQAQAGVHDKEALERRLDQALRRADTAEKQAKSSEDNAKSLELKLLAATTELEESNLAVQKGHERERSQEAELRNVEMARAEMGRKLAETLQELADLEANSASFRRKVDADLSEAKLQLSESCARCDRGVAELEAERGKSQEAVKKLSSLEEQLATRDAEVCGLQEQSAGLRRDLLKASAAREAAEQQMAPLAEEAARACRLREESATAAAAAQQEATSCRLEAEATRMAHYEQDREVHRLRERLAVQSEELERLQTLLAMGGGPDDVAAMSAAQYLSGPSPRSHIRDELAFVRKETRSGCPALPPAVTRRLASPRLRDAPLALQGRSNSRSRRPSSFASTAAPDDEL